MTTATTDLFLLSLGVVAILLLMTLIGEVLRARQPADVQNPVLDTYQTRVESW